MPERDIDILTSDPTRVGAVFENGRAKALSWNWERFKEIVPVKDVKKKEDREQWALENIRVFSDGTLPAPHLKWKSVIDAHLSELKVAARNANLSPDFIEDSEKRKIFLDEIRETENDIKAMMAISASARAMEASAGEFGSYATYMTQQEEQADLNKQDTWQEFLLHKDPEKKHRVLRNEVVRHFYREIMKEAGIKVTFAKKDEKGEKTSEEKEQDKNWWHQVDKENKEKALKNPLFFYLADDNPYKYIDEGKEKEWEEEIKKQNKELFKKCFKEGWQPKKSMNDYISDVLIDGLSEKDRDNLYQAGYGDTSIWAAARLACDVFMVDKMTRWAFMLNKHIIWKGEGKNKTIEEIKDDKGLKIYVKPFPGWGGDPLLSIIDPSFVPRVVKGVYSGTKEGEAILKMINSAFRPLDLGVEPGHINHGVEKEIEKTLPCSMTGSLKNIARYSEALFAFFGGSRASAIPQWTKEVMYDEKRGLPRIAELLDQVYGQMIKPKNDSNLGKHIIGAVVARILDCKAIATVSELQRPGFKEAMTMIFGDIKTSQPFYEVKQFLWGANVDGKSGFLKSLVSLRTRFIFSGNRFDAQKNLKETWQILTANDRAHGRAKFLNTLGFIMESVSAFSEINKKGR